METDPKSVLLNEMNIMIYLSFHELCMTRNNRIGHSVIIHTLSFELYNFMSWDEMSH